MDPLSRINYRTIYTVEHNTEVFDFGVVHQEHLSKFKQQWSYVFAKSFSDKPINGNHEEDKEDKEEHKEEAVS